MANAGNLPLHFFDNLLESNNLKSRKDTAINAIKTKYDGLIESIDYKKGIVKYRDTFYDQTTDNSIEGIVTFSFAKVFLDEINREAEKVKNCYDSSVIGINKNGNNANEYLTSQVKILTNLLEKAKAVYPKVKSIENTILEVIRYLVDRYSLKDVDKTLQFETYKKTNLISNYSEVSSPMNSINLPEQEDSLIKFEVGQETELINAVFGFMKGMNEKRERIMSKEQYVLMHQNILFLVEKEEVPTIVSKLNPINISNDLLSFTFWVLHEQLYTTKKIKPYFIEFLKYTFLNFENKELSSIRKGFGTKSRVTKDLFLPEIITQYL